MVRTYLPLEETTKTRRQSCLTSRLRALAPWWYVALSLEAQGLRVAGLGGLFDLGNVPGPVLQDPRLSFLLFGEELQGEEEGGNWKSGSSAGAWWTIAPSELRERVA